MKQDEPYAGVEVVLTGTGVPHPHPDRAGPGTLVRYGDIALQFDAGRSTVTRLMQAGTPPYALTAVFLTHVHSDHLVDLPDLAMSRWIQQQLHPTGPLSIVAPEGSPERFVKRMLDAFEEDIEIRRAHVGADAVGIDLDTFAVLAEPSVVWTSTDGEITVTAVAVHHEPVPDAVAYRVDTPAGSVVISGDTRVCTEVEELSRGADVLVHEACRTTAMAPFTKGTPFENIFDYHADTIALGAMAERAAVPHLVLTHLIPVTDDSDLDDFANDVREGGYTGDVTVGEDLFSVSVHRNA